MYYYFYAHAGIVEDSTERDSEGNSSEDETSLREINSFSSLPLLNSFATGSTKLPRSSSSSVAQSDSVAGNRGRNTQQSPQLGLLMPFVPRLVRSAEKMVVRGAWVVQQ